MSISKELNELKELCKPMAEYLEKKHHPYCKIVISSDHINLIESKIGIPVNGSDIKND